MRTTPVIFQSKAPQAPDLESFRVFANTYVVGSSRGAECRQNQLTVWAHGVGALGGSFIDGDEEAARILDQPGLSNLPSLGQELRGSISLYVLEHDKDQVTLLPDPLGGGIVFTHRDEDGWAASSDLGALVDFLRSIGRGPRKSLEYVAAYVATGSGGLVDSSYEGIEALPQFSYIEITLNGFTVKDYAAKQSFYATEESYDDSLARAEEEIKLNLRALASGDHSRKVAHLTGGIDSRAVLAAILSTGNGDQFSFYCSGGPTEPDQVIARQLATEYGLIMTKAQGTEPTVAPETQEEQLLWRFQHTSGLISGPMHRGNTRSSTAIASGGYGELFRSFHNKGIPHVGNPQEVAQKIFGGLGFSTNASRRLLSRDFADRTQARLQNHIVKSEGKGVRRDALLDHVYMSSRNRFFVGEITRSVSPFAARFDPLYSLAGASLALRLDGASRVANIVGMDLIERMSPGLSRLPFDRDRFSGAYAQVREVPATRDFSKQGGPLFDGMVSEPAGNAGLVKVPKPTVEERLRANELKMAPRLIAEFPATRDGIKDLIAGMTGSRFESAFNSRAVTLLVDRPPSHRVHYRTARSIYASLLWYHRG